MIPRAILVVEDDQNKLQSICRAVAAEFPSLTVSTARSYRSAVVTLRDHSFAALVLDMTIPTFDVTPAEPGGRPRLFGGEEVMRKMQRNGVAMPTVVVTQFEQFGEAENRLSLDQLDARLRQQFGDYRGFVRYSPAGDAWVPSLTSALRRMLEVPSEVSNG